MTLVALGSLIGVWEHIAGNLSFALEIHPDLTIGQRVLAALSGANPLMAPGMLALAAILAIAATYAHPVLQTATSTWQSSPNLAGRERMAK
jgi:hypothetical protein